MEENKLNLNFPKREIVDIVFGEQTIHVRTYLDITKKSAILDAYFADRYLSPVASYLEAELNLILNVVNIMTDIKVEISSSEKATEFVDNLLNTGAWYKIKGAIINFAELNRDIDRIIQQNNLEGKVNQVVDKASLFLDKISQIDFSVEGVQNIAKEIVPQLQQLATVFPKIEGTPSVSEKRSKKSSEIAKPTP